jgi:hypothetical protein
MPQSYLTPINFLAQPRGIALQTCLVLQFHPPFLASNYISGSNLQLLDEKCMCELRAESEYYHLSGLTELIDSHPYGVIRALREGYAKEEEGWIYDKGPDEVRQMSLVQ